MAAPRPLRLLLAALSFTGLPVPMFAQDIAEAQIGLTAIGRLATRHSREIASSNWTIGCEVLDRDLANYDHYKSHLGLLGAKHARLQAGWAKTAIFDDSWVLLRGFALRAEPSEKLAAYAFRQRESGKHLVAVWAGGAVPTESPATTAIDLELPGIKMAEPVVADMRTGIVYRVPPDRIVRMPGAPLRIRQVPIYDPPPSCGGTHRPAPA